MRVYQSTPTETIRITQAGEQLPLEQWEISLLHYHRERLFASEEEKNSHEYDIYLDDNGFCEVFVRPIGERYSVKQFKLNLDIPS